MVNNWERLIYVLIIGVILFFFVNRTDNNAEEYQSKLDSINTTIIKAKDSIKIYSDREISYKSAVDSLQKKLNDNRIKANKLKEDYEKSSSAIDKYDIIQLEGFFTDRYK